MSYLADFGHLEIHFNAEIEHVGIFHLEGDLLSFFMDADKFVSDVFIGGEFEVGIFSHNLL